MADDLVFTFYTYADAQIPIDERWKPTGLRDIFFDDRDETRRAVLAMRDDIAADPDMEWPSTNLEKVVTVPISKSSIMALLNDGPSAFIASYEVIETIGPIG